MKRESTGSLLSTVFVDYDNIYLSLKRKNEEAAKRFAKNATLWITAIASGELITPTNGVPLSTPRRIVMSRCYGNPVPRRNSRDNATDMNSFPFVRHHYLRAGFEVIDCPPLTAQLKNSADIRMVMDMRDYLLHDTYFDEFIILSGDADFTPVLHRLRAHARRTVIYANDYTAAPYKAICDGEVRESDLIALLLGADLPVEAKDNKPAAAPGLPTPEALTKNRTAIIAEVLDAVRSSQDPMPLEALADRAVRVLGHEKTVGSAWGGVGSFRDLLIRALPDDLKLSEAPPYFVFDTKRQPASPQVQPLPVVENNAPLAVAGPAQTRPQSQTQPSTRIGVAGDRTVEPSLPEPSRTSDAPARRDQPVFRDEPQPVQIAKQPAAEVEPQRQPQRQQPQQLPVPDLAALGIIPARPAKHSKPPESAPTQTTLQPSAAPKPAPAAAPIPAAAPNPNSLAPAEDSATALQQSIARIHDACQAPPLSPPEYRVLFDVMATEIKTNGLTGARTLVNMVQAAQEKGVSLRRDDARFILEVVSEADPWFEQGATAKLFASRFRNFVVARCRSQGMNLSATELDLIDAWFSSGPPSNEQPGVTYAPASSGNDARNQPQQSNAPQSVAAPTRDHQRPVTAGSAQIPPQGQIQGQIQGQDPFGGAPVAPGPQSSPQPGHGSEDDEFPRVIRNLARG